VSARFEEREDLRHGVLARVELAERVVADAERRRRHQEVAVRPRRAEDGAEVAVAHREVVRERVVERDDRVVLVEERALAVGVVLRDEVVVASVVVVIVLRAPAVIHAEAVLVVRMRDDDAAVAVGVGPSGRRTVELVGVQEARAGRAEAGVDRRGGVVARVTRGARIARVSRVAAAVTDHREVARLVIALCDQPPQVVIERAVLLHDHDDVVDRDVVAERVLGADRLRRPRARFEHARAP
jgi:hypothetical protein